MEVTRGAGVAVWAQIAAALEDEIRQGRFASEARLPTEAGLAERFGVNRHTVRRAVSVLARRGLVRIEQGRGTFVQRPIDYTVARRTRFSENLASAGLSSAVRLLSAAVIGADGAAMRALGLPAGTPLVQVRLLGLGESRPVNVVDHWLAADRFGDLPGQIEAQGSMSAALAACGVADYVRGMTRVTAILPEEDVARLLDQTPERPLLRVEALNLEGGDRPFLFSVALFPGDRVQLQFDPSGPG
ncbi:MAG: phosphonate metabolism transcriptional regulator PhnF [Rhodocyclaceae bacterium]|nr:phosphonate metabolism transcriptional regulator PhnF [Rhodocyclaceae bacterium]